MLSSEQIINSIAQCINDQKECPVCLETHSHYVVLACGHHLCSICLFDDKSIRISTCPLCRGGISKSLFHEYNNSLQVDIICSRMYTKCSTCQDICPYPQCSRCRSVIKPEEVITIYHVTKNLITNNLWSGKTDHIPQCDCNITSEMICSLDDHIFHIVDI